MRYSDLHHHYHPKNGWINDPNGLVCFGGYYHVFYQHAPHFEQPWHEPMVWGHARTRDFLHWEELPIALGADMPYDKDGAWSGTAAVEDGVLYLYYASICDGRQTVSVAFSTDGIHFEKYADNPIIREYPPEGSADFRDPAVFCRGGERYMIVASADKARNTGNLLLYRGLDRFRWEYVGVLYEYADARYCECPSFVPCGDGYLLSTSVMRNTGKHYFEVLYGDFDGIHFAPRIVSHFQKGPDEYAGQIFHADDGRNILISWVSGWKYRRREQCIGCLSLPLEILVGEEGIKAYPVAEVRCLLAGDDTFTDAYVRERYVNGGEEVYIEILPEESPAV